MSYFDLNSKSAFFLIKIFNANLSNSKNLYESIYYIIIYSKNLYESIYYIIILTTGKQLVTFCLLNAEC